MSSRGRSSFAPPAPSMEGEHEYGFWHVLVRDVCYGQIPRAARAARHRAAAAWIERKAGERVEDLADVLAYHYLSRWSSRAPPVRVKQRRSCRRLRSAISRSPASARLRSMSSAPRSLLAKALELAPADDTRRADLLERWAHAAQQQGRLKDARKALEEAAAIDRDQGRPRGGRPRLTRLALVAHRLGDPRSAEMITEARELLERNRPARAR